MSGDPTDEELEELRQKKMEQLKDRQGGEGRALLDDTAEQLIEDLDRSELERYA